MGRTRPEDIERCAAIVASAAFAGAVGFAALRLIEPAIGEPARELAAAVSAAIAYLPCARALARISPCVRQFPVRAFRIAAIEPVEPDELLLTDADRLDAPHTTTASDEPLELEDILEAIGPESRVARLFDCEAMPIAGQLVAR